MMLSTILEVMLMAFVTQINSSPVYSAAVTAPPAPTCTMTVLRSPTFDQNCTFKEHTVTATHYTDCGGCALQTRVLGVGLPCRTVTTVPGLKIETVTACKKSAEAMPTASKY